jgi:hypothetical protein
MSGEPREKRAVLVIDDEADRIWVKADVMLSKPVRFEQLQREINQLLRR